MTIKAARAQDVAAGQGAKSHPALVPYLPNGPRGERSYNDLREHLVALNDAGLLQVVDEPVDKNSEMHPLVRWQFRGGIPEEQRRAFFFTQPTDGKRAAYQGAVLIGGLAANRAIYRIGFGRDLDQVGTAWSEAIAKPTMPRLVSDAPCQQVVTIGSELDCDGAGLGSLPVPISSPGWDNAPYLSAGHYITKDPDTGVQNLGTYRGQLKGPRLLGMNASVDFRQGIYQHWLKYKARGEPMPCCVVVGCPPLISYAASYKVPDHLDELAVAGTLAGGPIQVVRAKTVDLVVPADAEYVIEGFISTAELEPEGPFGESHGHVNLQEYNAFMDVTAITHRRNPILVSIVSQVTPSESSTIRRTAMEPELLQHLKSAGVQGVRRVHMHEPLSAVLAIFVIQFARGTPQTEVTRGLAAAASRYRFGGRWIIAVDEDIDPANCDAVFWSMAYRCQPQHDVKLTDLKEAAHGPKNPRDDGAIAAVLVNATLKTRFAPVALPKREYMEKARALWERLGLPELQPEAPWHGYDLGGWSRELERQAGMAVNGDFFALGAELSKMRRGDVDMNTSIDRSDPEERQE
jgi:4-hydroxy-3-polyprenylbenzoate decarboxylase